MSNISKKRKFSPSESTSTNEAPPKKRKKPCVESTHCMNLYGDLPSSVTNNHCNDNKSNLNIQRFRYLVVLDFEATCDKLYKIHPQEIIEWPAMIIDTKTNTILSDKLFHFYMKPKYNPRLTPFCTNLTGITQEFIDKYGSNNSIESVTEKWNKWCFDNDLLPISKDKPISSIIICGDWDLKTMWKEEKKISKCCDAALFHSWINIKTVFKQNTFNYYYSKHQRRGGGIDMMSMLNHFNIKHEGRHHSGIDDVKNICKIVQKLLKNGVKFDYTTKDFETRNIGIDINIHLVHIKAHLAKIQQKKSKQAKQKKQRHVVDLTNDDEVSEKKKH